MPAVSTALCPSAYQGNLRSDLTKLKADAAPRRVGALTSDKPEGMRVR